MIKLTRKQHNFFAVHSPIQSYQFQSQNYKFDFLEQDTNYLLIPGIWEQSSLPSSTWKIVRNLLKNKIIDVCLPYAPMGKDNSCQGNMTDEYLLSKNTMARYILYQESIVGIRINLTTGWPRNKFMQKKLPQQIIMSNEYSNQIKLDKSKKTCPVGEFFLIIPTKTKIGFFFQDQLIKYPKMLIDYYSKGCQVFAVIDNISIISRVNNGECVQFHESALKRANTNLNFSLNKNQFVCQILIKFAKTHKVICLYTGYRIGVSPLQVFWTIPFIVQGDTCMTINSTSNTSFIRYERVSVYANGLQGETCRMLCNLELPKSNKEYIQIQDSQTTPICDIDGIQLRKKWPNYNGQDVPIGKSIRPQTLIQIFKVSSTLKQGKMQDNYTLSIINLFYNFNKKNPFVLSLPLTQKTYSFVSIILMTYQYISQQIPLKQFLLLYLFRPNGWVDQQQLSAIKKLPSKMNILKQVTFDSLESLIAKADSHNFHFYSDDFQQLNNLKQFAIKYQTKERNGTQLTICDSSILNNYTPKQFSDINYNFRQISSKPDKLYVLSKQIVQNHCHSLQQIFEFLIKNNLEKQEVEQILQYRIKSIIKKNMNNSKVHIFFTSRTNDEIIQTFQDIQLKFRNNQLEKQKNTKPIQIIDLEEDDNSGLQPYKDLSETDKMFQRIKRIKYFKKKSQRIKVNCHCCKYYLKDQYGNICKNCKKFFCWECYEQTARLMLREKSSQIKLNYCLYCMKLCNCLECKLKNSKLKLDINNEEDKQKEKKSTSLFESCQKCQIQQPKYVTNLIKLQCQTCEKQACFYCLKRKLGKQKFQLIYTNGWKCNDCYLGFKQTYQDGQTQLQKLQKMEQQLRKKELQKQRIQEQLERKEKQNYQRLNIIENDPISQNSKKSKDFFPTSQVDAPPVFADSYSFNKNNNQQRQNSSQSENNRSRSRNIKNKQFQQWRGGHNKYDKRSSRKFNRDRDASPHSSQSRKSKSNQHRNNLNSNKSFNKQIKSKNFRPNYQRNNYKKYDRQQRQQRQFERHDQSKVSFQNTQNNKKQSQNSQPLWTNNSNRQRKNNNNNNHQHQRQGINWTQKPQKNLIIADIVHSNQITDY